MWPAINLASRDVIALLLALDIALNMPLVRAQNTAGQGVLMLLPREPALMTEQQRQPELDISQGQQAQEQHYSEQSLPARHQAQQALPHDPEAAPERPAGPLVLHAAVVDERALWHLLHASRLYQFDQQLHAWRRQHPDWRPSPALLAERQHRQQQAEFDAILARGNVDQVAQLLQTYPQQFSCNNIDHLWRAAEIFAQAQRTAAALALYASLIPDCQPAARRIATLYMAQQHLASGSQTDSEEGRAGVAQLIATEAQSGQRDAASQQQFLRLQYQRSLAQLSTLPLDSAASWQLQQQLAPQIMAYRDAGAATLSGWILLAQQRSDAAQTWFLRACAWSQQPVDAALGLVQIALEKEDLGTARIWLAQPWVAADPRAQGAAMRLQLLQAASLQRQHDYAASLSALDIAGQLGADSDQSALLRGWDLYALGHYAQAATVFAQRYRSVPDADSAQGWAFSEQASGGLAGLLAAPEAQQPPLRDYLLALQSQQLYYRKQFIDAYALQAQSGIGASPVSYLPPSLHNMDAASVTSGFTFEEHAGSDGENRLQTLAPTLRGEWIDDSRQYNLRGRELMLDAGTLSASPVAQAIGVPASYQASGQVRAQDLWFAIDDSLGLPQGGRLNWHAGMGLLQGGAAGSDLYAQLSVGQQTDWGSWLLYGGSNPLTDSLLSWRGENLPGSGQFWGDVRRNAIGAHVRWQAAPRWSLSAATELAQFTGSNVQSNQAIKLDLGAAYDLQPAGFDYFNLGPALHFLHYANNQDQYDWGLGGYYSPQRAISAGIASQFLTLEGRQRQWSGQLELGLNSTRQSAAACLPVALPSAYADVNSGTINCGYAASSASGPYAHLQLALVQSFGTRWQLGLQGVLDLTPGRDRQYATMLFLRYFFSDRSAVFSRDLPFNNRDFYGQLDDGR